MSGTKSVDSGERREEAVVPGRPFLMFSESSAPVKGREEVSTIRQAGWMIAVAWTVFLTLSFVWNWQYERAVTHELALTGLRLSFEKDVVYRRWAAEHGGVYVPATEKTPPNPYLSQDSERDIATPSGRHLTLVNPAYMTRQVQELGREQYGMRGHITSLTPLRPENAPDPWEASTLQTLAAGAKEVVATVDIDGKPYLRLMKPFFTEEGCLKCHVQQGYRLGDIRGGISVSTPMEPYLAIMRHRQIALGVGHSLIWIMGLGGIGLMTSRLGRAARERLHTLEVLGESEARYRTLFERTANPVLVIDTGGSYFDANEAALDFLECSREELLTKNVRDFVPPESRPETIEKLRNLWESGGRMEREYVVHGRWKILDMTITPGMWRGKPVVFSMGTDITLRKTDEEERLTLERQLQQAKKAESLGRMAGAIAHHFNNLLGAVMGNLELATLDLPREAKALANIAKAMTASIRAAEISRLMLAYLGQSSGSRAPIELSEVCREALPLLTSSLPQEVHLKTEFPDEGAIIRADAVKIRQVLTNLVVNAGEAMAEREGDVVVAISLIFAADIQASRFYPPEWEPKDERYVCLSVADTGAGMDQETLEKVFDPFFSTKFAGRGLGLAVVEGVVKAHHGALTVDSAPGRGSVFRVFLPLSAEELRLPPMAEPFAAAPPKELSLVLLVDDEPMFRNLAQTMLELLGCEVITAGDGVEALEVFRAYQDHVQCVVLDLTMPRMDGWETLAALRALRPDLPVILASGYDEARAMAGDHPERPQTFLQKPYRMVELEKALGKALKASLAEDASP
jgi:PAS domain S-box-containing protein